MKDEDFVDDDAELCGKTGNDDYSENCGSGSGSSTSSDMDDLEAGSLVASSVSSASGDSDDDEERPAGAVDADGEERPSKKLANGNETGDGRMAQLAVEYGDDDDDDDDDAATANGGCDRFLALPPRRAAVAAEEGEDSAADDEGCGASGYGGSNSARETRKRRLVEGACTICLVGYEAGDEVAWSAIDGDKCGSESFCQSHAFHKECIVTWLSHGKEHCPMCRRQFVPPLPGKAREFAEP